MASSGRVAASARDLLRFCESSTIKLNSSKHHLENLLSYEAVLISPPPSTSGGTGSTISATAISQVTDYDVSRELDDFFGSLFSAFDIFGQVINRVFFSRPLSTGDVSFYRMCDAMVRNEPAEILTRYITSLRAEQWYRDMNAYRRCTTHQNEIEFDVRTSRVFLNMSFRTKIVLPDNPFSHPPSYSLNREFGVFGVDIFSRTLNAVDHIYGLMEAKVKTSSRVPV